MKDGIHGGPLPPNLPYATEIEQACEENNFSPMLAYAVKQNETGPDDPADIVSAGGGYGIFQLTSSYPSNWADPLANARYAITQFLQPAYAYWQAQGFTGTTLVKLVAASFNEGLGAAIEYHAQGNVDIGTTNNYGERAVDNYVKLVK